LKKKKTGGRKDPTVPRGTPAGDLKGGRKRGGGEKKGKKGRLGVDGKEILIVQLGGSRGRPRRKKGAKKISPRKTFAREKG